MSTKTNGANTYGNRSAKYNEQWCHGHAVKRGVGAYADSNPGLRRYTGVDDQGNPKGANMRGRLGERSVQEPAGRVDLPDTTYGMSDKLPRK